MCFSELQNSVRNLTSLGKKHDFCQKVNIMTARLQEARVIPSKYNGVAVVEITHIYQFWVEFYNKNLQLEMTIMYEVKQEA